MKKLLKRITLLFIITPLFVPAQRAPSESSSFDSRIFSGGNLGLQFGSYTLIEVAPILGYKITDKFTPGIGITYMYENAKVPTNYSGYNSLSYITYTSSIYGGNVFMRYYMTPSVFAHVEYQVLNLDVPTGINGYYDTYKRGNVANFFIGGGYRQPMGEHSSFNIMLLYDIIQDPNSPYSNPVIEVGFGFGI